MTGSWLTRSCYKMLTPNKCVPTTATITNSALISGPLLAEAHRLRQEGVLPPGSCSARKMQLPELSWRAPRSCEAPPQRSGPAMLWVMSNFEQRTASPELAPTAPIRLAAVHAASRRWAAPATPFKACTNKVAPDPQLCMLQAWS